MHVEFILGETRLAAEFYGAIPVGEMLLPKIRETEVGLNALFADGVDVYSENNVAKRVIVSDSSGEKEIYAAPPGAYKRAMPTYVLVGPEQELVANVYYRDFSDTAVSTNGYLHLTFGEKNTFFSETYSMENVWRFAFDTKSEGNARYVGALRLPKDVLVPENWRGTQSFDYTEYPLLPNTFYDITVESVGGSRSVSGIVPEYRLSCKGNLPTGIPKPKKVYATFVNNASNRISNLGEFAGGRLPTDFNISNGIWRNDAVNLSAWGGALGLYINYYNATVLSGMALSDIEGARSTFRGFDKISLWYSTNTSGTAWAQVPNYTLTCEDVGSYRMWYFHFDRRITATNFMIFLSEVADDWYVNLHQVNFYGLDGPVVVEASAPIRKTEEIVTFSANELTPAANKVYEYVTTGNTSGQLLFTPGTDNRYTSPWTKSVFRDVWRLRFSTGASGFSSGVVLHLPKNVRVPAAFAGENSSLYGSRFAEFYFEAGYYYDFTIEKTTGQDYVLSYSKARA